MSHAVIAHHGEAELATKQDLRELDLKIQAQFVKTQGQLILLRWMLGFVFVGIAALVIKAFF